MFVKKKRRIFAFFYRFVVKKPRISAVFYGVRVVWGVFLLGVLRKVVFLTGRCVVGYL